MKRLPTLLISLIAFVAGGLLGAWWSRKSPPVPDPASAAVQVSHTGPSTEDELRAENRQLQAKLGALSTAATARTGPASSASVLTPLEQLRSLAELQQRGLVKPGITVLDRKGRIDAAFAGLFALTIEEQDRLQRSIDGMREKLADLERARAKISRDDKGNITVAIPAFPDEGGKLYDETLQAFADVLGSERNDAFRQIAAEQFERAMGRFGAADRTYVFGYDTKERPGQPYTFEDQVIQRTPRGGVSSSRDITRFQTFEEMTGRVGPIVSILPPEYPRGK